MCWKTVTVCGSAWVIPLSYGLRRKSVARNRYSANISTEDMLWSPESLRHVGHSTFSQSQQLCTKELCYSTGYDGPVGFYDSLSTA